MKLEAKSRLLALSSALYHYTSAGAAAQILLQDRFALKPSDANFTEETLIGRAYYLSCARSPTSHYFNSYPGWCVLELDGAKLATRYKGKPVSYWGPGVGDEMEDRILSPTPFIEKASRYIKAVHCIVPEEDPQKKRVLALYKQCLLKHIPIYFGTGQYLKQLKPSLRVPITVKDLMTAPNTEEMSDYTKRREAPTHQVKIERSMLLPWQLLMKLTPGQEKGLTPEIAKSFERKKRDVLEYRLFRGELGSALHNAKSDKYGDPLGERERMEWIVTFMRSHDLDQNSLIDYLREKWK